MQPGIRNKGEILHQRRIEDRIAFLSAAIALTVDCADREYNLQELNYLLHDQCSRITTFGLFGIADRRAC